MVNNLVILRKFTNFEHYLLHIAHKEYYMKKITILIILIAISASLPGLAAIKKEKKYDKQQLTTQIIATTQLKDEIVVITNPAQQLYGEWVVETLRKKTFNTNKIAHIYIDSNLKQFYGNNSCNTINGKLELNGDHITFKDIITTTESCNNNNNNDRNLMKAMVEVQRFQVTTNNNVQRLQLLNNKGNTIITLKRQNHDILNGAWLIKNIHGEDISGQNVKVVVDVNTQAIHGNTGCNIINGIITLDPRKDFAIQFEDLHSSNKQCDDIEIETDVLLALEQTEFYKTINTNQIELLNNEGKTIIVLTRLNLKK